MQIIREICGNVNFTALLVLIDVRSTLCREKKSCTVLLQAVR